MYTVDKYISLSIDMLYIIKIKMKFLLIVLGVTVAQTSSNGPQKLLLTVLYESKCPDSRNFILNQLVPTINQMHDYVQLSLVPFGKAKSINEGYNGFECQHGPTECLGNMVQDCTLDQMVDSPNTETVKYVACEMQSLAGTVGSFKCIRSANLSVERAENCVNSRQGVQLQLFSEYLTGLVTPKFIPTVTINGYFNQQIQDRALVDLFGMLCSLMPEAKPCADRYNTTALRTILF